MSLSVRWGTYTIHGPLDERSSVIFERGAIWKRHEFTERQRDSLPTYEPPSMNQDHDRKRGVNVNTGGPEDIERETVL